MTNAIADMTKISSNGRCFLSDILPSLFSRKSAKITLKDVSYTTIYLGNITTQWGKGKNCVSKPLSILWRNYCLSMRPDIKMELQVSENGLCARTKVHGLTEYWNYRITYHVIHPNYPNVLCWIYRHEGKNLKQELRCHAVFCKSLSNATHLHEALKIRRYQALTDYRKEKLMNQNNRLSSQCLVQLYMPPKRRVLLLNSGSTYRPGIDKSKCAPKLTRIMEDTLGEERELAIMLDDEHRESGRLRQPFIRMQSVRRCRRSSRKRKAASICASNDTQEPSRPQNPRLSLPNLLVNDSISPYIEKDIDNKEGINFDPDCANMHSRLVSFDMKEGRFLDFRYSVGIDRLQPDPVSQFRRHKSLPPYRLVSNKTQSYTHLKRVNSALQQHNSTLVRTEVSERGSKTVFSRNSTTDSRGLTTVNNKHHSSVETMMSRMGLSDLEVSYCAQTHSTHTERRMISDTSFAEISVRDLSDEMDSDSLSLVSSCSSTSHEKRALPYAVTEGAKQAEVRDTQAATTVWTAHHCSPNEDSMSDESGYIECPALF